MYAIRSYYAAQLVVREHADDRLLHHPIGMFLHFLANRAGTQATGIPGVAVGHLVVELVASDGDLVGVDDDDEIAPVDVGRECRLVLAAQQVGCSNGESAEHHVGGVDDVPRMRSYNFV